MRLKIGVTIPAFESEVIDDGLHLPDQSDRDTQVESINTSKVDSDKILLKDLLAVFFICLLIMTVIATGLRIIKDNIEGRPMFLFGFLPEVKQGAYHLSSNPFSIQAVVAAEDSGQNFFTVEGEQENDLGPMIKIGLFQVTGPQQIVADRPYKIVDSKGFTILTSEGSVPVYVWYDKSQNKYFFKHQQFVYTAAEPFVIQAGREGVLQILSYYNPPKWDKRINDNKFRNSLFLNYSAATNQLWMINELPLEDYLKGLAETKPGDNFEYLKVMSIVGRSYAYYHLMNNFKHQYNNFHLDAYWDQVYRGYNNEVRHPELVKAVEQTRGRIVTYQGEVAVTPYFARSNGKTKSWSEVWYGNPYPWVVPVEVPWERGLEQLGHGVGLSAIGAMIMANNGWQVDDIIKYFYQGVEIAKLY